MNKMATDVQGDGIADYSVSLHKTAADITDPDLAPLLQVGRLQQLAVELTTSCNLACVYCHFAPLDRRGNDLSVDLIQQVIDFVKSFPVDTVTIGGDSELTMFKGWEEVANRLLEAGCRLRTISNFTNGIFTPEQVAAFSRFGEILVSLDTADAELLKKTRYRADLRTMTLNVQQIRAKCLADGIPQPRLVCNAVVHDKNLGNIDELAAFAIANGFNALSLQRMVGLDEVQGGKNDFWDNPNAIQLYPLSHMSDQDGLEGLHAFRRMLNLVEGRIEFSSHPALNEEIARLLNRIDPDGPAEEASSQEVGLPTQGRVDTPDGRTLLADGRAVTKACLMPWNYLHVMWNGDIPPCCIVKDGFIANADGVALADIINSDAMKEYRAGLLTGQMKPLCVDCSYVPETDTDSLKTMVQGYLQSIGQPIEPVTL